MAAMKYFVWTLLVWVPVFVLTGLGMSAESDCGPGGCIGFSAGFVFVALLVIAVPVYVLGLLVLRWWDRTSGPPPWGEASRDR